MCGVRCVVSLRRARGWGSLCSKARVIRIRARGGVVCVLKSELGVGKRVV